MVRISNSLLVLLLSIQQKMAMARFEPSRPPGLIHDALDHMTIVSCFNFVVGNPFLTLEMSHDQPDSPSWINLFYKKCLSVWCTNFCFTLGKRLLRMLTGRRCWLVDGKKLVTSQPINKKKWGGAKKLLYTYCPNTKPVRYLNGRKLSDWQMVWYSNIIWILDLNVQISNCCINYDASLKISVSW